jgi:hypothetical protein
MEFRKPHMDEAPDEALVRGHEWKIFPLLHRRSLFADVEHFHLFDFFGSGGRVNEDVLAYSNRQGDDRSLVVYHNKFATAKGWIRISAAALDKRTGQKVQRSLGEALGLPRTGYAIFKDASTHLEHIRPCGELWEKGLYAELQAYEHHVYMDWQFVDGDGWRTLCDSLAGAGVESLQRMYAGQSLKKPRALTTEAEPARGAMDVVTRPLGETARRVGVKKAGTNNKVASGKKTAAKPIKKTAKVAKVAKKTTVKKTVTPKKPTKPAAKKPAKAQAGKKKTTTAKKANKKAGK